MDRSVNINRFIGRTTNVGSDYVITVDSLFFVCLLCGSKGIPFAQQQEHVESYSHKWKFLRTHFTSIASILESNWEGSDVDKLLDGVCYEISENTEKRPSRQCSLEAFQDNSKRLKFEVLRNVQPYDDLKDFKETLKRTLLRTVQHMTKTVSNQSISHQQKNFSKNLKIDEITVELNSKYNKFLKYPYEHPKFDEVHSEWYEEQMDRNVDWIVRIDQNKFKEHWSSLMNAWKDKEMKERLAQLTAEESGDDECMLVEKRLVTVEVIDSSDDEGVAAKRQKTSSFKNDIHFLKISAVSSINQNPTSVCPNVQEASNYEAYPTPIRRKTLSPPQEGRDSPIFSSPEAETCVPSSPPLVRLHINPFAPGAIKQRRSVQASTPMEEKDETQHETVQKELSFEESIQKIKKVHLVDPPKSVDVPNRELKQVPARSTSKEPMNQKVSYQADKVSPQTTPTDESPATVAKSTQKAFSDLDKMVVAINIAREIFNLGQTPEPESLLRRLKLELGGIIETDEDEELTLKSLKDDDIKLLIKNYHQLSKKEQKQFSSFILWVKKENPARYRRFEKELRMI